MSVTGVVASHITSFERLYNFKRLLESITAQTSPLDSFIFAVSSDVGVESALFRLLESFAWSVPYRVHLLYSTTPLKQFEHYSCVASKINTEWVLFSDDDDLWHSERVVVYKQAISDQREIIRCNQYRERRGAPHNYIEYMIRKELFVRFFEQSPVESLGQVFCDVYFVRFLRQHQVDLIEIQDRELWMYDWIEHEYESNHRAQNDRHIGLKRNVLFLLASVPEIDRDTKFDLLIKCDQEERKELYTYMILNKWIFPDLNG